MTAARPRPDARASARGRRLASLCILGLGLAGCASGGPNRGPEAGWLQAGSPKELEVERAQYRHMVYFDTDSAALRAGEVDRLLAFLDSVDLEASDSIRLEGHADERATDVYNLELASRRVQSVQDFLRRQGVRGLKVQQAAFGEQVPDAPGSTENAWQANRRVELTVERHVVVLPPCPDWSRESGHDFANLPHSNQGCATETNLGLMIAEPRDLVRGRTLGPADGTHAAEAIVRYRTGKVTKLQQEEIE